MAYNVLIIDDEPLIRTGLRLSVPWEALGFQVIAEAGTAMEALERLENTSVQLALVDIQMPGTNGIEFIKEMRRRFPHIKSLIISGHGDFEYTVSALKLEVCDYLLKPIDLEKLIETIKAIRERMEQEEQSSRVLRGQRAVAGKMLALRLLGRDFKNREEVNAYCSQCGIAFPLENYCATAMKLHKFPAVLEERYHGQRSVLEAGFDQYLSENTGGGDALFTALVGDYYTVLTEQENAEQICYLLHQKAKEEGLQIKTGRGEAFQDIFFMDVSYLQAIEYIRAKEETGAATGRTGESRLQYLNELMIQKLEERRFEEVTQIVDGVLLESLSADTGAVFNWCINSLYSIVDYFQLSCYEEMKDIVNFDIQTMSNLYFFTAVHTAYREKIDRICRFLEGLKGSSNEVIVTRVMKIVKEDYAKPELSLQKIAADLGISYNYLSTIFKQISGENFSGYLTRVKMSRARQLVLEGKLKMYEIAEQVGYVNAKYFAEQFKKSVGMTPSEYKAKKSKEE